MKKRLLILLTVLMAMFLASSLVACSNETTDGDGGVGHEHTYEQAWTYDDTYHYHKCMDATCTEVADKTEHVFANDCDATCDCGYQRTANHDFTGEKESLLSKACDVTVRVPETETYKVQEFHLPVYHCLCAMLEEEFF